MGCGTYIEKLKKKLKNVGAAVTQLLSNHSLQLENRTGIREVGKRRMRGGCGKTGVGGESEQQKIPLKAGFFEGMGFLNG